MHQLRRKKRGFTLTEIAIVLGIIGTILGAIWTASARVTHANKVTKLVTEILAISEAVRSNHATRSTMSFGCLNTFLAKSSSIPSDMVNAAAGPDGTCGETTLSDPWGKTVDIGSQWAWDGLPMSPSNFEILVGWPANDMKSDECQSVLSQILGSAANREGITAVASTVFTTTDTSTITDKSFLGCTGHFTIQFSLH